MTTHQLGEWGSGGVAEGGDNAIVYVGIGCNLVSVSTFCKLNLRKLLIAHRNFLHLVTETGQAVQISVHRPSSFVVQNLERVLPGWDLPVLWVVIVLQQARYELVETTPEIEQEKERLREKFLRFGFEVVFNLRDRGFESNLIDPRTGYPLLSRPGEIPHDDTAVVKALLGLRVIRNRCCVLEHPLWGKAVYPSTLLSSAPVSVIKPILRSVGIQQGWKKLSR